METVVLPGQIGIDEIEQEKNQPPSFKLTVAEKRFICAYYKYRAVICVKPTVGDILEVFKWEEETNERYYPAYRDFAYDDQRFPGAFHEVQATIKNYLIELDSDNRLFFHTFSSK